MSSEKLNGESLEVKSWEDKEKSVFMPNVRVSMEEKDRFMEAFVKYRTVDPDATLASWIRRAMRAQAEADMTIVATYR